MAASNGNWIIEEIKPLYFDATALREPSKRIHRLYTPRGRYYYTYDERSGEVKIYIGVTTMIGKLIPKGDQLIDWMVSVGREKSWLITATRAAYGTAMHRIQGEFTINRKLDLDRVSVIALEEYDKLAPNEKSLVDLGEWNEELSRDLLAWAQFVKDYNFRPIAIEVMLAHPDGYAGTMDFLGYMTIVEKIDPEKKLTVNNKSERDVLAAIDNKSGRKGFYDSHEIQLESYRSLIHNEWPDLKVEKIYNWSPKEWRTEPGYNLKDQSNSVDALKFQKIVEMAKIELMKPPTKRIRFEGSVEYGADFDYTKNVKEVDVLEYIREYHQSKSQKNIQISIADGDLPEMPKFDI